LVAGTGVEPITEDYESSVIPFHYPAIVYIKPETKVRHDIHLYYNHKLDI